MANPLDMRTSRRSLLAGATAAAMLPLLGTGAKADDAPKHGGRFRMALAGSSTTSPSPTACYPKKGVDHRGSVVTFSAHAHPLLSGSGPTWPDSEARA